MLKLLSLLCHWHGLAKLRMHTDDTLQLMDDATESLGGAIRAFETDTSPAFRTKELKREAEHRQRREARTCPKTVPTNPQAVSTPSSRLKSFNLRTYKFHALGDYTTSIQMFGTTDSYSTQPVSNRCYPWMQNDF